MEEPLGALPYRGRSFKSSCSFRTLETVSSLAKKKLPSHRQNHSQPGASHIERSRTVTVPSTPVLASYAGSLDAAAWAHATRGHETIEALPVRLHSTQSLHPACCQEVVSWASKVAACLLRKRYLIVPFMQQDTCGFTIH